MKFIQLLAFFLWSLLNICGALFIALYSSVLLFLRYQEMHTVSTAMDPNPNLTRETVVWNVISQSGQTALLLLVFAVMFWGLNVSIYEREVSPAYRRIGIYVFWLCALTIFSGVIAAGVECLNTSPQTVREK